jgi:hypothetical protein
MSPLSPTLYNYGRFSEYILERERVLGNLHGISIVRGVKETNHSQFVDDTLLLGGASFIIVARFKIVLDQFLNAYGGKVNNEKIHIYGWNISGLLLQNISRILDFPCLPN